jgi:DNA-binding MarR family transcriptional regulator
MIQKLKDEIRPAKASSFEQEVFVSAQRAADWLMRDFEELLKPHHLSPTQYNVLRILRGAGNGGMACHEIAERMITRDPDMTRLLDRLEEHDLISRSREKQDRRVIRVRISHQGLHLLKQLDDSVRTLHRRQLGHLGEKRLRLLAKLLQLVREH